MVIPVLTTFQILLCRRTIPTMLAIFPINLSSLSLLLYYIYTLSSTSLGFDMGCFQIPEFGWIISNGTFPMERKGKKPNPTLYLRYLGFYKLLLQKAPAVMPVWHWSFQTANIKRIWSRTCCILTFIDFIFLLSILAKRCEEQALWCDQVTA